MCWNQHIRGEGTRNSRYGANWNSLGLSSRAPSRGSPQHSGNWSHYTSEDIFFFRLIVIYLLHNQTTHDMNSFKFFCAGLSCFVLAIFLLFYGYQIMPFESLAAEIIFFSLLISGSAVFIGQAIWLAIEKKFE